MSAGTVDLPVVRVQSTETVPTQPTVEPHEHDRVGELCRRMTTVCESAVDALEVASALESEGISDQAARTRYGFADVFTLADYLYYRVPRRPVEPPALPPPWLANRTEHVLHGLLYALPAVCFPVAAPLLGDTATLIAFVASTLASWAASQALAYLGFARAGRLDSAGSLRILRAGAAVALAGLWLLLTAGALLMPVRVGGLIFAGGQATYLLAATVLLVCGKHVWLLLCLAPGVLISAAYLALGRPVWLAAPVWWALGATIVATLVCVAACTARPGPGGRRSPAGYELRGAVSYALFGLAAAGLLSYPVVASRLTGTGSDLALLLATPLSLSMGAAEWSLYWYRRRTDRLLHTTRDPRQFAFAARRALLATTTRYLTAAAVLIVASAGIVAAADRRPPRWMTLMECTAFLALGGALFVALLLQAFGGDLVTPLACAAAVVTEVAMTAIAHLNPVIAQLVACAVLTAALLAHAASVLSRAARHA